MSEKKDDMDHVDPPESGFGFDDDHVGAIPPLESESYPADQDPSEGAASSLNDSPVEDLAPEGAEESASLAPKKKNTNIITGAVLAAIAAGFFAFGPSTRGGGTGLAQREEFISTSPRPVHSAAAPASAASDSASSVFAAASSAAAASDAGISTASMFASAASAAPLAASAPVSTVVAVTPAAPASAAPAASEPISRQRTQARPVRRASSAPQAASAVAAAIEFPPTRRPLDLATPAQEVVDASASVSLRGFVLHAISPPHGEEHLQAWVRVDGQMHVLTAGDVLPGTAIRIRSISNARRSVSTTAGALIMR